MIVFDLQCSNGHTFEGWFEDGQAHDDQKEKGLITCPVCNDTCVSKMPSTFAIKSSPAATDPPSGQKVDPTVLTQKIIDFVNKSFDDVGCDFAKEALKIHYGAAEPRNIKGISTKEEEKTLKEEGIEFFKVPMPKTDAGSGNDA